MPSFGLVSTKPGTLCDRSKLMTIRFDYNANVDNRCYRVTDANFAVGDRQYIGSHIDIDYIASVSYRYRLEKKSSTTEGPRLSYYTWTLLIGFTLGMPDN